MKSIFIHFLQYVFRLVSAQRLVSGGQCRLQENPLVAELYVPFPNPWHFSLQCVVVHKDSSSSASSSPLVISWFPRVNI